MTEKAQKSDNALASEADLANVIDKFAGLDIGWVRASQSIYEDLTKAFPTSIGKAVSKKEREQFQLSSSTLVYGEISFEAFGITLEKIKKIHGKPNVGNTGPAGCMQDRGGIFYDLGSGTGKAVIAAAILYNFDICCGIEILEGLYTLSLEITSEYNSRGKAKLNREITTDVSMVKGDILDLSVKDWSDGDVIFANSTCFDDTLMAALANTAGGLKKGTFFITFTKRLPGTDFVVLEYEMHQMSWGAATVYIHQKITESTSFVPRDV